MLTQIHTTHTLYSAHTASIHNLLNHVLQVLGAHFTPVEYQLFERVLQTWTRYTSETSIPPASADHAIEHGTGTPANCHLLHIMTLSLFLNRATMLAQREHNLPLLHLVDDTLHQQQAIQQQFLDRCSAGPSGM